MIRKAIPVLTHVDNLSDMKIDMSAQERSLEQISDNTTMINMKMEGIRSGMAENYNQLEEINVNTTSLQTSVGLPADESTSNTVIGLLKSIANKLS